MLTLIRHGESLANAQGRLTGWQDVPLTPKGCAQAEMAGELLLASSCQSVWASDLVRAKTTAEIAMNLWSKNTRSTPSICVSAALRERRMGVLQGHLKTELKRHNRLDILKTWSHAPEFGESFQQLAQRVFPCLEHIPDNSFVFAHGGVIRMILGVSQGVPASEWMFWTIPNATPIEVEVPKEGWQNRNHRLHNDTG